MSNMKRDRSPEKLVRKSRHQTTDFSKVGGLLNHINILRDTIIVPLLHSNVYSHFNIKTPRGVLFYGPPGTGKTLVAGALATELNKEGLGKVNFYQRKGADVLDKWVGESEKKLRTLFETATKNRPSIIFFDELDGLAPIRSAKNDHVHCSIVTTLLALMDGLDSVPGVIVIGATNRIESVDPALRRPGRFDRELYFPLPSTEARREILQVHMQSWKHKPLNQFVSHLAEITSGFCGSDLQALCAEALLCAMKRQYPNVQKCLLGPRIKIEATELEIDNSDFINARRNLIPACHKLGNRMRKLSPVVAPLLQNQLNMILSRIRMLWSHFFQQFHKYLIGSETYIGRIVLVGSNLQGLNAHLVPAILHNFEHLPNLLLDASTLQNRSILTNFCKNLPSILVIPRIDDLWNFLEIYEQTYITSLLEDIHGGLPILIVATYEEELPLMLQNFFYNNTCLIINIENPSEEEIENFFIPLFFAETSHSLHSVFLNSKRNPDQKSYDNLDSSNKNSRQGKFQTSASKVCKLKPSGKIIKSHSNLAIKKTLKDLSRPSSKQFQSDLRPLEGESLCTLCGSAEKKKRLSLILTDLLQRSIRFFGRKKSPSEQISTNHRNNSLLQNYGDSGDVDKQKIYTLWRRTVLKTSKGMPLAHLQVLYDTISACINIHRDSFPNLIKNLETTLSEIECIN